MSNTTILTGLDPDEIKAGLKTYLSSQSQFSDYDFEGSGLNVLLDLLTYTLYNTSFYINMVGNESFIDTAQLRSSIASHCKILGYVPESISASFAIVTLQINSPSGNPDTITIPSGTRFTTSIDGQTYYFYTNQTYVAKKINNYIVENVKIIEGVSKTYSYTVNSFIQQNYIIPSKYCDINYLTVQVKDSSTSIVTNTFSRYDRQSSIDGDSLIYFIYENKDGFYELKFGDGNLGKKLTDANVIIISYAITSGSTANGANVFSLYDNIGYSNVTVTTTTKSTNGSDKQSNESIVHSAINDFHTQRRAVTAVDYKTIIENNYANADSVKVWGGEDNIPPVYGKVFISIKPTENFTITNTIKTYITDTLLKPYRIVGIVPEIVDPDYTKILVDSTVNYNSNKLGISEGTLESNIIDSIVTWAESNVNEFDKTFRGSKMTNVIDDLNSAVLSNSTSIQLQNSLQATLNTKVVYEIYFNNPIKERSLSSTGFSISNDAIVYYLEDDGLGNLIYYKIVSGSKVYPTNSIIGSVDYTTGYVRFSADLYNYALIYSTVNSDNTVDITVTPTKNDIVAARNQILLLDESTISLTMNGEIV